MPKTYDSEFSTFVPALFVQQGELLKMVVTLLEALNYVRQTKKNFFFCTIRWWLSNWFNL